MMDVMKKFSLDGKTVFVCAGAGLIGAEISGAAAGAGAQTVILDIDGKKGKNVAQAIQRSGGRAFYEHFDLADLKKTAAVLERLVKKYGMMDAWINAAYPRTKDWGASLENLSVDSLRKNVDMHLNSFAWSSRVVALMMRERKTQGSIINFGSIYGVQANDFTVYEGTAMTSPMAYAMIKGGIVNVSRFLASYFGPDRIRVNTICPGGIFDGQNKTFVKNYERKVPLKRMGTPQDTAGAAIFLASDASSYITGCTLMVDGGWTIV